jgi:hypothetical protein
MDTHPKTNGDQGPGGFSRPIATFLTCVASLLAGVFRLIPHPAGFSPMGAVGLYGGARLRSWHAFALPIGLMVMTDVSLWQLTGNFIYSPFHISRTFVYGSFLIYVLIGRMLTRTESVWWIGGAALLGSLQFFVITNFCTWLVQPWVSDAEMFGAPRYSRDLVGILHCFAAALPFYEGVPITDMYNFIVGDYRFGIFGLILGDLVFSGILFGLHAWLSRTVFPAERVQVQPSGKT